VTGRPTGDVLPWDVSAWLPDNRSFIYHRPADLASGAPATGRGLRLPLVYLHVLGRDPQNDPAVFGSGVVPSIEVTPNQGSNIVTSPNSAYAVAQVGDISRNFTYYIEPLEALGRSQSAWRRFADSSDKVSDVAVHGDDLYLLSSKDASRYKILRTDARRPDLTSADLIVSPSDAVVQEMTAAADALYVLVLDGGINRILRVPYGPHPNVENVALPFEGSASVDGADPRVPGILIGLESRTKEYRIYAYDPRDEPLHRHQPRAARSVRSR
jgi:prolyl oligopeptidase